METRAFWVGNVEVWVGRRREFLMFLACCTHLGMHVLYTMYLGMNICVYVHKLSFPPSSPIPNSCSLLGR